MKPKTIVARNSRELAEALGLQPEDAVEIEVRSDLNDTIMDQILDLEKEINLLQK